jgi:hypothetical protein
VGNPGIRGSAFRPLAVAVPSPPVLSGGVLLEPTLPTDADGMELMNLDGEGS